MKIGMLVDRYKPYISGITNYVSLNKKYLEQAGHHVYIFTFGDEDYADEEDHVIRSPGLPLVDSGYYLSLGYKREARRLLYTMDIAHVHHPFISGSLALRYCRARGIPIIFTNHTRYDLYTHAYLPILPDIIGETALKAFLPVFCRACDLIISPSEGMRQVLIRFGVDTEIFVVPNGVDLTPLQAEIPPFPRQELGIGVEDVVLIYVGRLGPEKNLPFLLRSFSGTAQAYEHVHLILIGDGPERDNLQDRVRLMNITHRVHFTGLIPYEKLPTYLKMADAFVTASVTEVHPLSVIEAMASGLPVLGIHSPGVGDSITDGETGFLTDEDLAAFTAKMVRLVTDHEVRRRMGKQARQAAEQYHIAHTTQTMLQHYKRLEQISRIRQHGLRSRLTRFFDRWN